MDADDGLLAEAKSTIFQSPLSGLGIGRVGSSWTVSGWPALSIPLSGLGIGRVEVSDCASLDKSAILSIPLSGLGIGRVLTAANEEVFYRGKLSIPLSGLGIGRGRCADHLRRPDPVFQSRCPDWG